MTIDEKVNDDYTLTFITQENFEKHVNELIDKYYEILSDYDLKRFNSNLIDPIKLSIDKYLLDRTWKEIIDTEINRQRDKTITNALGDFHQNIFKYIDCCEVPKTGFDLIYTNEAGQKNM
ncbi:MAG TPA: Eco47II family restriction endonuclease [Bacilli bacterium]|nr:Eco47II family restriction endonuclease [Bacilli bacterium]